MKTMIVSNTGPIIGLSLIGRMDVLQHIFDLFIQGVMVCYSHET